MMAHRQDFVYNKAQRNDGGDTMRKNKKPQWHNSITKEAIAEAVKLSSEAFFRHTDEFV